MPIRSTSRSVRRRTGALIATACVALLGVAGCSSDSSPGDGSSTTVSTTEVSTTAVNTSMNTTTTAVMSSTTSPQADNSNKEGQDDQGSTGYTPGGADTKDDDDPVGG